MATLLILIQKKLKNAIFKAITATRQGNGEKTKRITKKVIDILGRRFAMEKFLMLSKFKILLKKP